ncbi:uncharacterized protein AMSG_04712 [Thecamonas trahens ATCC 50062]|uniref:Uncharacterized protein n=1 Tax=Thecamonas trahens ATCC 50062 TaxID=461836 RepID=A0A0L0D9B0_THETB|nr:hypothetical protein AMSG_04712 [Thecamonas trahens ATCC 50062]KNC48967.1 hypothetical protein AMSG_04712 [Thecamonas trahens ATCC 50062]|eukprot:XP_013758384.1 hypothetical protein AMSG_04712 [Thecamonas trahens ATCC 50062]
MAVGVVSGLHMAFMHASFSHDAHVAASVSSRTASTEASAKASSAAVSSSTRTVDSVSARDGRRPPAEVVPSRDDYTRAHARNLSASQGDEADKAESGKTGAGSKTADVADAADTGGKTHKESKSGGSTSRSALKPADSSGAEAGVDSGAVKRSASAAFRRASSSSKSSRGADESGIDSASEEGKSAGSDALASILEDLTMYHDRFKGSEFGASLDGSLQVDGETLPRPYRVLDSIWSAFKEGVVPVTSLYRGAVAKTQAKAVMASSGAGPESGSVSHDTFSSLWTTYVEAMQDAAEPSGSVLVLGAPEYAYAAAAVDRSSLFVVVAPRDAQVSESRPVGNVVVTQSSLSFLETLVFLNDQPDVYFDAMVVPDLGATFQDLLPHEFTKMYALALTLARSVWVPSATRLFDSTPFLGSWANAAALLTDAAKLAGVRADVGSVHAPTPAAAARTYSPRYGYAPSPAPGRHRSTSMVRMTVREAARTVDADGCARLGLEAGSELCVLSLTTPQYNVSANVSDYEAFSTFRLGSGSGRHALLVKVDEAVMRTVPLHVVLALRPLRPDAQLVLKRLLLMPPGENVQGSQLALTATSMLPEVLLPSQHPLPDSWRVSAATHEHPVRELEPSLVGGKRGSGEKARERSGSGSDLGGGSARTTRRRASADDASDDMSLEERWRKMLGPDGTSPSGTRRSLLGLLPRRSSDGGAGAGQEHAAFDALWAAVRERAAALLPSYAADAPKGSVPVLCYGAQAALLGLKLVHAEQAVVLYLVLPPEEVERISSARSLARQLGLASRVLVFPSRLDAARARRLASLPDAFPLALLGVELWQELLAPSSGAGNAGVARFADYLSDVLSLASESLLQMPAGETLEQAYGLLSARDGRARVAELAGIVERSVARAGVGASAELELVGSTATLRSNDPAQPVMGLARVSWTSLSRTALGGCSTEGRTTSVELGGVGGRAASSRGISLAWLQAVGMYPSLKRVMFRKYLELELTAGASVGGAVCPLHLRYRGPQLGLGIDAGAAVTVAASQLGSTVLAELAGEKTKLTRFSMICYESGRGEAVKSVAMAYPNATIISLESSTDDAIAQDEALVASRVRNVVVGTRALTPGLAHSLYVSPEFLRFQVVSRSAVLAAMTTLKREAFETLLGELFGTALTTFVELPSAELISSALATLFPEEAVLYGAVANAGAVFEEAHAVALYKDAGLHVVGEGTRVGGGEVVVSAAVVEGTTGVSGRRLGWQAVRVDALAINTVVNHHFEYQLDGHARKYAFSARSNASGVEVFLQREEDGFRIPYESIEAVTLIAVMRLQPLARISNAFYDMFLALPLYEDMAPWNIVFRSGQLDYIDYDTKDVTFDDKVGLAYQLLSALMNFERTVKDFGHCGSKAGNGIYNFGHISSCVKSDNRGPCRDPSFPVPCGDGKCHPEYISCLRSLNAMEQERNAELAAELEARLKAPLRPLPTSAKLGGEEATVVDANGKMVIALK